MPTATKTRRKSKRSVVAKATTVDSHLPGIARAIYDGYANVDLLPIDPDVSCASLARLARDARSAGDGLFSFLVDEVVSTMDGADPAEYAAIVARTFNTITSDVNAIRLVLEKRIEEMADRPMAADAEAGKQS